MFRIYKNCFGCHQSFLASFDRIDVVCDFCRDEVFTQLQPLERIIACENNFDAVTSCYSLYSYQNPIKNLILATKIRKEDVCATWLADTLRTSEEVSDFFVEREFQAIPQSTWSRLRGKYSFQELFLKRLKQHYPDLNLDHKNKSEFSWEQVLSKRSLNAKQACSPSFRLVRDLSQLPEKIFFDDITTTGLTANTFCKDQSLWNANWLSICDSKRPHK